MDKKAKQILFNTFWSSAGWTKNRNATSEDFEYAKSKGLMFDAVEYDHNMLCSSILNKIQEVDKQQIAKNFISTLSTRNLRHRSFLSSYAIARVLNYHDYDSIDGRSCDICGVYSNDQNQYDLNVMNFEKLKWGGVRLSHLEYIKFDLDEFKKLEALEPQKEDFEILNNIKQTILSSKEDDRPRQLEKRLAKVFKSNSNERENVLNIFGICGILETESQKGFFSKFINVIDREDRPVNKTDWSYPIDWWQGKFGINEEAWKYYFE